MREQLVAAADDDDQITAAALTGSATVGRQDRWSDIDLAFRLAPEADRAAVIADWTERMYGEPAAVHHVDVFIRQTVFRVFLLADTLQVDLAFWPDADFRAIGPTFELLFGSANEPEPSPTPIPSELIGMAWLHALHARSSIARGRVWQAEYMITGVRDRVLALACLRHGVSATEGRGLDDLPDELSARLQQSLVGTLDASELVRTFCVVTEALIAEIDCVDGDLSDRLAGPLRELAGS